MSTREIGEVLGVGATTVRHDLSPDVPNGARSPSPKPSTIGL
jgi:hypothetical protein